MGKFALIYDDGVHGRHLDSVARGIQKLNREGYQTVVVSPTRPEGAKYWAKPDKKDVNKLGALLKGRVGVDDEVVIYTTSCSKDPYTHPSFDFENFFALLNPPVYRQRNVITHSPCRWGFWKQVVESDKKKSQLITGGASDQIPAGIKEIDEGQFKEELERMLVEKRIATQKEVETPDFYAEGHEGHYYVQLLKNNRSDPSAMIEAIAEIQELIKKYGIETFVQIARETTGSLATLFHYLARLHSFVQNKEDLIAKARLISRALPFAEPRRQERYNKSDWTDYLNNDFVGKHLEEWTRLMEITQGGVLDVFDSVSRIDDLVVWIERYGWSQFFELAKYAGKDTGKTIALFLNNIDWKTWKSGSQMRMGTNLWWKWKEMVALAAFTKEGTSRALEAIRNHFLSDSKIVSPDQIFYLAKKGGIYTGSLFKVLPGLWHLVESGLLTRDQLIDKIVENAKRCGAKHSAVFTTLAEIAEIIASGEDLDLKTQKILEMTEDAEKPVPLGKFDRAIKKYGISPFAELAKIVAGQRGGVEEVLSELDLKWVDRYGIKPFVEMAKHYGDNPDAPISRWFSAMDHGPASMFEVLVKTYGMEAVVQLFRDRVEILRWKEPTLIFSTLYRWRKTVKSKEDMIRLLDILFKRRVERRIVPIEFSNLFLELYKGKPKSLEDLENFYRRAAKNLVDIPFLLDDYRHVTLEKLTQNRDLYKTALELARELQYGAVARAYHFPPGLNVEEHLIANLDLRPLIKEATDAGKVATTLQRLSNLSPDLARRYAEQVTVKQEWVEFNFREINAETLSHASNASAIVSLYEDLFPEDFFSHSLQGSLWKEREKKLVGQLMSAKLGKMPVIKDLDDLTKFYEQVRPLKETIPAVYERFVQGIMSGVDLTAFVRDSTRGGNIDSKMLEEVRRKLNEVHRVLGDEFVLMIGIAMSKETITKENFFKKLEEVSACCFRPEFFQEDVGKLYAMIGRFQANRLADFLIKNKKLFSDNEVENAIESLKKMGVIVDFEDGVLSKTFRSLKQGQVGYVVKKGWGKLTAGGALRDEVLEAKLKGRDSGIRMQSGFSVKYFVDEEERKTATIVIGKKEEGGRAGYEAGVGTGVDVKNFKQRIGDSLTALSIGAFTTGERKLADFAAIQGGVVNYLVSDRDGLILFYPDGTLSILDIEGLKKSDIPTPGFQMKDEPMAFRDKVEDFNIFLQKLKRTKVSVMQGQLLLHNGELKISDQSSGVADKRRMLAVMEDGSFALIDFESNVTLLEGAVLAKKMGARHLVNLDTGMYDFSQFIDAQGKAHKLGTFDSERPTNLIYFYSDPIRK